MCDLDEVDRPSNAFGKTRYILIEGLNETEKADVISGKTTVYSSQATIQSDTLVLPGDWKKKTFVGTLVKEQKLVPSQKNYTVLTEFTSASNGNSKFQNVTYVVSEEVLAASATLSSDIMFSFNVTGDGTTQVTSTKDYYVANNSTGTPIAAGAFTDSSVAQTDVVTPSDSSYGTRKLATPSGVLNVLIVRVTMSDKSPTENLDQLRNKIYGTSGDTVNLKTQLMACSNNKVTFGKMDAIEAFIPMPVNSKTADAESAVTTKYANQMNGYQLKLIVLPHGTYRVNKDGQWNYNWIAYAWVGGDTSVYNDRAAIYADNQVHEIGHNFGLGHAWYKGVEYGDTSSMVSRICFWREIYFISPRKQRIASILFYVIIYLKMGFGQSLDDGKKCYNSANNIKLGWHRTVTCTGSLCNALLVGVDDAKSGNVVNINMDGKYSVGFNRKKGMNLDTSLFPDRLLVHTLEIGPQRNELVAGLLQWEQFVVHNKVSGKTLSVFPYAFDGNTNSVRAYIRNLPSWQVRNFEDSQLFVSPFLKLLKWITNSLILLLLFYTILQSILNFVPIIHAVLMIPIIFIGKDNLMQATWRSHKFRMIVCPLSIFLQVGHSNTLNTLILEVKQMFLAVMITV
jgi:hypothetical protein